MSDLVILRTHRFEDTERNLAERLSLAFGRENLLVVLDARKADCDPSPFMCVRLRDDTPASLGLEGLPRDWGWRCGDLCYYLGFQAFPNRDRYWLVESDVWFSPEAAISLFSSAAAIDADGLAAGLACYQDPPRYSRQMLSLIGTDRLGCLFPFTMATPRLIAAMRELRMRTLKALKPRIKPFPNDEAVFAGALHEANLIGADLYTVMPQHFARNSFATNPPELLEALEARRVDHRVHHPAIPFKRILSELQNNGTAGGKRYDPHRLRRVLEQADESQREELLRALRVDAPTAQQRI